MNLDAIDCLHSCQSDFHPGYSMNTVLIALVNDLCLEIYKGKFSLLISALLASFDMINLEVLIKHLTW